MSTKYNKYAMQLKNRFIEAREEYASAYAKVTAADEAVNKAKNMTERFIGEKAAKIATAESNAKLARAEFNSVSEEVWANFNREKQRIGAELAEAVRADTRLDPDTIDGNAVKLLEAGVMTARDFEDFANKYQGNNAMLALIAKYAGDIADNESMDFETRAPYMHIARHAKESIKGTTMQAWEQLSSVCDTMSGQAHGKGEPSYTMKMNSRFEELAGAMIEAF